MPYFHLHSHYHLPRLKEMGRIYWCHSLSAFGNSLILIFVPIYLLKIGYSFESVLIYLLLQQFFSALLQYPAGRLFEYLDPHRILVLGVAAFAILFLLLNSLVDHKWPLALLALFWALNRTLYWVAFHYLFSLARAHKRAGRQIAGLTALNLAAATAAPAIGGAIASLFGIRYVYILAVIILVLALLPMLTLRDSPPKLTFQMPPGLYLGIRRNIVANFCNGIILMGELNIWPLFVYLIVTSYAGIGVLSTVIAVASILTALRVGRSDLTKTDSHYMRRGTAAYSLASLGRAAAQTAPQIFGLNLLSGIGRSLYVTPYMNRYYDRADGPQRLGFITITEMAFSLGSLLFVSILLLLTLLFAIQTVLTIGLVIVGFSALGVRLMR